jgi:hypothetical protein
LLGATGCTGDGGEEGESCSSSLPASQHLPQLSAKTAFLFVDLLAPVFIEPIDLDSDDSALQAVVCGPCTTYAALSLGLAALHLADGGPTPGMDPRVVRLLAASIAAAPGATCLSPPFMCLAGACTVWLTCREEVSRADAAWVVRQMVRLVRVVLGQGPGGVVGVYGAAAAHGEDSSAGTDGLGAAPGGSGGSSRDAALAERADPHSSNAGTGGGAGRTPLVVAPYASCCLLVSALRTARTA